MMEEQKCKKCKNTKSIIEFYEGNICCKKCKDYKKITITITKIDTMKRKEKDMNKMNNNNISKRNWNKNTITKIDTIKRKEKDMKKMKNIYIYIKK